jgi:hypothetical protein
MVCEKQDTAKESIVNPSVPKQVLRAVTDVSNRERRVKAC